MQKEYIIQTKIVLQGAVESFYDYQERLNIEMAKLSVKVDNFFPPIAFPSAASDGRLCCVINYKTKSITLKQPKKRKSESNS